MGQIDNLIDDIERSARRQKQTVALTMADQAMVVIAKKLEDVANQLAVSVKQQQMLATAIAQVAKRATDATPATAPTITLPDIPAPTVEVSVDAPNLDGLLDPLLTQQRAQLTGLMQAVKAMETLTQSLNTPAKTPNYKLTVTRGRDGLIESIQARAV